MFYIFYIYIYLYIFLYIFFVASCAPHFLCRCVAWRAVASCALWSRAAHAIRPSAPCNALGDSRYARSMVIVLLFFCQWYTKYICLHKFIIYSAQKALTIIWVGLANGDVQKIINKKMVVPFQSIAMCLLFFVCQWYTKHTFSSQFHNMFQKTLNIRWVGLAYGDVK